MRTFVVTVTVLGCLAFSAAMAQYEQEGAKYSALLNSFLDCVVAETKKTMVNSTENPNAIARAAVASCDPQIQMMRAYLTEFRPLPGDGMPFTEEQITQRVERNKKRTIDEVLVPIINRQRQQGAANSRYLTSIYYLANPVSLMGRQRGAVVWAVGEGEGASCSVEAQAYSKVACGFGGPTC